MSDKDLEQLKKEAVEKAKAAAAAKAKAAAAAKAKAAALAKQQGGAEAQTAESEAPAEVSADAAGADAKAKAAAAAKAKAAAAAKAKAAAAAKAKSAASEAAFQAEGATALPEGTDDKAKAIAAAKAKAAAAAAAKAKAAAGGAGAAAGGDDEKAKAIAAAKAKAAAVAAAKAKAGGAAEAVGAETPPEAPSPNQPYLDKYIKVIKDHLGEDVLEDAYINKLSQDVPTLVAKPDTYYKIAEFLKYNEQLGFDYLSEHHGSDFVKHMEVYNHLYSYKNRQSVALKVKIDRDNPVIDSLTPLWPGADWPERESYDLVGITYTNHPNLTRIMLADDWVGHPLRKDYEQYDVEV
ncbi:NADH-quinone oxidoreductase subunit C [Schinkia azotoformans]|uniref:NAD(P)H dehydrogenase subunit J n=1 Tax=Schinkia azotoformans LMG 9581 TaxID=1131731 RepID=K6BV83_SCHAZ|nr:NADH-quinone oxidoreductase subunit C [Schinkia azotoformans]EKN62840.1 NADH dehydrogenase subunit C [Schinkia azotoformans LMG 9581]MEC1639215.1 NADH-quinone oxidoreductase subunit C [Schinkia azotoformans]MEC1945802.1 NADH-quinone oxidoreductase subunit C [Schinkia azotoformans]MED4351153.1 NADH-quinone oxidoreductase subunit C [Schinkia azotoformans]